MRTMRRSRREASMPGEGAKERDVIGGGEPSWLADAIDQAADVVFIVDDRDRIRYLNRRASELTGIPADKLLGETILKLVEPSNHGAVLDALRATVRSDGPGAQLLEMAWNRVGAPEPVYVEAVLHPVRADSQIVGCIGIARDVSKRREYQAERLASERVAAVRDLARSAAHKINNPLAILITHLAVMEREAAQNKPCEPESIGNMKKVVERIAEATKELAVAADTSVQKAILGSATPELSSLLPPRDDDSVPAT